MRTRTITKLVKNLTPDEYARCARLNLRFDGYMQEDLQRERHDKESSARVVMIKDTESDMLIAWSLAYPHNEGMVTHYYTRKTYRRQGYGGRLIKAVQKFAPKPIVVPGDEQSRLFFKAHKDQVTVRTIYAIY